MTVSIIIPAWNAESTLRETINSALSQSEANEIIVVDDGSTDRTFLIAKSFGRHVTCLTGPNNGVAVARNRGFAASSGEWIQFLDSDDLLTPGTLSQRVDALLSQSADVAVTHWTEFHGAADDENGAHVPRIANWERLHQDGYANACATSFWAPPAALLYRRSVVERIGGFRGSVSPIEDARFLFDAANLGAKFCPVDTVGALYRVLPDSFSRRNPSHFALAVLKNGQDIEATWRSSGPLNAKQTAALIEIYNGAACMLFRSRREEFRTAVDAIHQLHGTPGRYARYAAIASRVVGMNAARNAFALLGR